MDGIRFGLWYMYGEALGYSTCILIILVVQQLKTKTSLPCFLVDWNGTLVTSKSEHIILLLHSFSGCGEHV